MLPKYTYLVKFFHRDPEELNETVEHITEESARSHFASFDESDADIYKRVVLTKMDWTTLDEEVLQTLELPA